MKTTLPVVCVVIDDDIDDIDIFKIAIANLDLPIEIIAFTDCEAALEKLLSMEIDPHCIVLDSRFPAKTGYECFEKIKITVDIKEVPVIILSGGISIIEEIRYSEAGIRKFLKKQSSLPDLEDLLKKEFLPLFSFPGKT